ncbi:MAG: LPS export ABC transporter permease LptG, partial [Burkholderiaceae bacterium]
RRAAGDPSEVFTVAHALTYVALGVPWRLYQLMPICVLIGTILVLTRLASTSEFTILRASGLGPWLALRVMLILGLAFAAFTFIVGDYLAPLTNKNQTLLKVRFDGSVSVGRTGAWLKATSPDGQRTSSVNVGAMNAKLVFENVTIYEFDQTGRLLETLVAKTAVDTGEGHWRLKNGLSTVYESATPATPNVRATPNNRIEERRFDTHLWPTGITTSTVSVALLDPYNLTTVELYQYVSHLDQNQQSTQRYEVEFWRKLFYPLGCLVMVVLALPFAYLHFRSEGTAGYVFLGFLVGISYFLLNSMFSFLGVLSTWQPWLSAAAPSLIYSAVSLTAFAWFVLRR